MNLRPVNCCIRLNEQKALLPAWGSRFFPPLLKRLGNANCKIVAAARRRHVTAYAIACVSHAETYCAYTMATILTPGRDFAPNKTAHILNHAVKCQRRLNAFIEPRPQPISDQKWMLGYFPCFRCQCIVPAVKLNQSTFLFSMR